MSTANNLSAKAKQYYDCMDANLSQSPSFRAMEEKTKVPKTYIALAGIASVFVLLFFNIAGSFWTNLIGWVYPAIASMKAVDSTDQQEKKQWLTYWVIFGFVHILDEFSDAILYMVPFFFLFKTLFLLYLALPQFKGAAVLYDRMALAFPDYFGKASTRVPPRKEN